MKLVRYTELETKKPRMKDVLSEYRVETGIWNQDVLQAYYSQFLDASEVVVLQQISRYYSGKRKKPIDLKKISFWDVRVEDYGVLKIRLSHDVYIRTFLKGFFADKSFRKTLLFPVEKVGLWEREDEMLREICHGSDEMEC
ncbi:hypothetical protein ES703_63354 [subsurface metagenome]